MTRWIDNWPWTFVALVGFAVLAFVFLLIGPLWFAARDADARFHETWDGAVIVRICRDGSRVFRLRDGRTVAGSYEVENVETVCGAVK